MTGTAFQANSQFPFVSQVRTLGLRIATVNELDADLRRLLPLDVGMVLEFVYVWNLKFTLLYTIIYSSMQSSKLYSNLTKSTTLLDLSSLWE